MKITYLLLMLAFIPAANGQDYCGRIKREALDDKKNVRIYFPLR